MFILFIAGTLESCIVEWKTSLKALVSYWIVRECEAYIAHPVDVIGLDRIKKRKESELQLLGALLLTGAIVHVITAEWDVKSESSLW